jgi:phospholipase C
VRHQQCQPPSIPPVGRRCDRRLGTHAQHRAFHPAANDPGLAFLEDLAHDRDSGHDAFAAGRYDRWVPAKKATTMAYLTRDDIPFHYALADAFTICDAYHCPLIGPTDPNRYYMWTGFTGNDGSGSGPVLAKRRGRVLPDDVPRAAGEGRRLLEDLPGRRRRARRGRRSTR